VQDVRVENNQHYT